MLNESNLHEYQRRAVDFIERNPGCGLFLDMGLGKTITTLTAIEHLMYHDFDVNKVLVIAPLRVARDVWTTEANTWEHVRHLRISSLVGDAAHRKAGLEQEADVYVINRENVEWLYETLENKWPFDMVVIDELSSFKNPRAKRFKALRRVRGGIRRIVGLTGTPAPNGLIDLWPQMWLIDKGERLGKTVTGYRSMYFTAGAHRGAVVFQWKLRKGAERLIRQKIADICISMKSEDYLELPEILYRDIPVKLSDEDMERYRTFERDSVMELKGKEIAAFSAAALTIKLAEMSNGFTYYEEEGRAKPERVVARINTTKFDYMLELLEQTVGEPVLCFYSFQEDLELLLTIPGARKLESTKDIEDWNEGRITLLLAHPASAGHGLNLQRGGHIVIWYSLPWSLELYQQANKRLHRQGQTKAVTVFRLVASGTVDEDIAKALTGKENVQESLLRGLRDRVPYFDELI